MGAVAQAAGGNSAALAVLIGLLSRARVPTVSKKKKRRRIINNHMAQKFKLTFCILRALNVRCVPFLGLLVGRGLWDSPRGLRGPE